MPPSQYKKRYESLVVAVEKGGAQTIKLNRYRARYGGGYNEKAVKAFLDQFDKSGVDMTLQVDSGSGSAPVDGADLKNFRTIARYVFAGKGSPEHCQMVLQLVDHWKLAPSGLQAYADEALGLDCNGFVGNYLWHDKRNKPWTDQGLNDDEGPDSSMSQYKRKNNNPVERWEDMAGASSYIFIKVDESGAIFEGGGPGAIAGHIAITEPNRFRAAKSSTPSGVWVVESTIAHNPGLWESWYSLDSMSKKSKHVFKVHREEMKTGKDHEYVFFRIFEVN